MVSILDLKDAGEFTLYATESDMQEAILFQPSLLEDGFRPITSERPVDPGFIDILGVDKNNVLTVVEMKRVKATKKAVLQLKKYMDVINLDKNTEGSCDTGCPLSSRRGTGDSCLSRVRVQGSDRLRHCTEVLKKEGWKTDNRFFQINIYYICNIK